MSEFDPEAPPLENLSWPAEPPRDDPSRARLLELTSRFVRGRRHQRRLRLIASWSVAYSAGLATAMFTWRGGRPAEKPAADRAAPQAAVASVAVTAADPKPVMNRPPQELSPEELRNRVFGAPRPEQIRLLRLAGDQYLYGRADVASALDCYRQVIELTPPAKLAERRQDDSWLLAELKSSAASLAMDEK